MISNALRWQQRRWKFGKREYSIKFAIHSMLNTRRARATVTVPTIFRDFSHSPSNHVYCGSNSEYINPVEVSDTERKLIWPDTEQYPPDIIISIGAGRQASSKESGRQKSWLDDLVILDPLQCSLNAQDAWDHFRDSLPGKPGDDIRYVRLNVSVDYRMPKLDAKEEMNYFKKLVKEKLGGVSYKQAARQIIASCFFFDIIQPPTEVDNGSLLCKGICRSLTKKSLSLLNFLQVQFTVGSLTLTFNASVNISMRSGLRTTLTFQFMKEIRRVILWFSHLPHLL
jgi:hypothetical protein